MSYPYLVNIKMLFLFGKNGTRAGAIQNSSLIWIVLMFAVATKILKFTMGHPVTVVNLQA